MRLLDLIHRNPNPAPWEEGDNIPWHDPAFSARMLHEHLSQAHDSASRRQMLIEQHVAWIHEIVLSQQPTSLLDLGCGPGFYTSRLARVGHRCTGIDYAPASIAYAKGMAGQEGLACDYHLADIRHADFAGSYGLIMLLFGEFNVFRPDDARLLLAKSYAALAPGGLLLLEAHLLAALQPATGWSHTWYTSSGGIFSAEPHLCLIESLWQDAAQANTRRYYILHTATGTVNHYAQTLQAYTPEQYQATLTQHGFGEITILPGLAHDRIAIDADFCAIIARKPPK